MALRRKGPRKKLIPIETNEKGCWLWTAAKRQGYGCGSFDGKIVTSHRGVYERTIGPVPEGLQLDHLCKTLACCNPAHLEPVTPAENSRRSSNTRLTIKEVNGMRGAYATGLSHKQIAELYKTSIPHTINIIANRCWTAEM